MNCTAYSLLKTKRKIKRQTKRQIFHFGPTCGTKDEARKEKLLQGVTPLL